MNLLSWIDEANAKFKAQNFSGPRSEAELLAAAVLSLTRAQVISGTAALSNAAVKNLNEALLRRLAGESLAYIVGRKGFYKTEFFVGPGVLVPRPETEHLVEEALRLFPKKDGLLALADFGAGSGCIGLSLLLEWPQAILTAIENSDAAREYLARNIEKLGLKERVKVLSESVEFSKLTQGGLDLIVANPPYIDAADPRLAPDVRQHEPAQALFADEFGLGAIRRWSPIAARALRKGGFFLMEIGFGQADRLREDSEFCSAWSSIHFGRDLADIERFVIAQK